jgi:hypothetical protein
LPYTELGKERAVGKIETGKVFEQPITVVVKKVVAIFYKFYTQYFQKNMFHG